MRIVVACLCLLLGTASTVFSLPVTFDFSAGLSSQYVSSGLTLAVSADSIGADGGEVTWTRAGLGVSSGINDNAQLENSGPDEFLGFKFSKVGCSATGRFQSRG